MSGLGFCEVLGNKQLGLVKLDLRTKDVQHLVWDVRSGLDVCGRKKSVRRFNQSVFSVTTQKEEKNGKEIIVGIPIVSSREKDEGRQSECSRI